MASRLTEVIIDCRDLVAGPAGPAGPALTEALLREGPQPPAVALVVVPEEKTVKNRVHVDLTPVDGSQADEVARLEGLGARRIDIGQSGVPWVVMADPEGNELCVMPGPGEEGD